MGITSKNIRKMQLSYILKNNKNVQWFNKSMFIKLINKIYYHFHNFQLFKQLYVHNNVMFFFNYDTLFSYNMVY